MVLTQDPTIAAGDLRDIVTLLAPIYNDDQDEIIDWNPAHVCFAQVAPIQAFELNEAGRTIETITTTIVIRYRADLDARWRIQNGRHIYEIKGLVDVQSYGVLWNVSCQEVR